MNFLDKIVARLSEAPGVPVLAEVRDGRANSVTGSELMSQVAKARAFLTAAGLRRGDRCALLAHNSIRWAALDLAMMAEGVITVPLYARHAPAELIAMIKDCSPARICCGDAPLAEAIARLWPSSPPISLFDEVFAADPAALTPPRRLADSDILTIIYTSGTSGEPKGVMLNAGNLNHMLACTNARLDLLMGPRDAPDRVFHYAPFCFAASWILLLTCLSRNSYLALSTDLSKLADEMKIAAPDYFLNVPTLLERVRARIEQQVKQSGGIAAALLEKAKAAQLRRHRGEPRLVDSAWLGLANALMFPTIRKSLGANLKALICGSAPLAVETQLFFMMLGIPVLQVYGLTETTAICTMDDPRRVEPGRVGPAIPGIEMKAGENEEIVVRGPNVFPGYWNRPDQTAQVLRDGWFHTGDQGDVDARGNWRITGRLKNLIILNSGHNIAPEPLEDLLLRSLPGAQQVMLVGNNRSFLAAIVTGEPANGQLQAAFEKANAGLPHYKQVRAFHVQREPFTVESGLLTANGKLRRDAIAKSLATQIEEMYRAHRA